MVRTDMGIVGEIFTEIDKAVIHYNMAPEAAKQMKERFKNAYNLVDKLSKDNHNQVTKVINKNVTIQAQQEKIDLYREFAKDIATDWDHDEDAHKYDTHCRMCMAQRLLDGQDPWDRDA